MRVDPGDVVRDGAALHARCDSILVKGIGPQRLGAPGHDDLFRDVGAGGRADLIAVGDESRAYGSADEAAATAQEHACHRQRLAVVTACGSAIRRFGVVAAPCRSKNRRTRSMTSLRSSTRLGAIGGPKTTRTLCRCRSARRRIQLRPAGIVACVPPM